MPGDLGYGSVGAKQEKPHQHHSRLKQYQELFPSMLTIALFAIFGSAIVNGVRLCQEPNARYWVGEKGYAVLAIPPIVILAHIVQSWYRRPIYICVIASCAFPPIIAMVTGYLYMVPVNQVVDRLMSTDCTTFQTKFHIEQAYKAASGFFDECLASEAKNRSTTVEVVRKDTVITDCPGYDPKAAGYAKEWAYLQSLEQVEKCAGWCFVGEGALWTHNPRNWDSCSSAAGVTMKNTVARNAARMLVNGLVGFLVAFLFIFLLNECITRMEDPKFYW